MSLEQQKKIFNIKQNLGTLVIQELLKNFPEYYFEDIHNNTLFMASEKYLNVLVDQLERGVVEKLYCEHCNKEG